MKKTERAIYNKPYELMEHNLKEQTKKDSEEVEVLSRGEIHSWIRPIGSTQPGMKTFTRYLTFKN